MARIIKSTITLDIKVLNCTDNNNGAVMLEMTVEEAKELYNALKDQFEGNDFTNPQYRQNKLFDLPAGPNDDIARYNYPASSELDDEPF